MTDDISFDPMKTAISFSEATGCAKEYGAGKFDAAELENAIKATWLGLLHPNEDCVLAAQQQMEAEQAKTALENVQEQRMADAIAAQAEHEHNARAAAETERETQTADAESGDDSEVVAEGKENDLDTAGTQPVVAQADLDGDIAHQMLTEQKPKEKSAAEADKDHPESDAKKAESEAAQREDSGKRETAEQQEATKVAEVAQRDQERERGAEELEAKKTAEKDRDGKVPDGQEAVLAKAEPVPERTTQERIAAVEDQIVLSENLLPATYKWESPTGHTKTSEMAAFEKAAEIKALLAKSGLVSGMMEVADAHHAEHGSPTIRNAQVAQQEFQASKVDSVQVG
ncbi:MAG: hypothetical protein U1E36_05800 [Rickettsiales bacterium]